ncbi:17951_t:CDS:2 [Cetraspora pellucida]|uniref:17951_t:CDS:1 n=1 Tax=Cetraspora pellucida TaxID=1433469 RepID=A0A9N9P314_9GLOM|nr:17951_t:CDS:2 [Cetraspora pellucida]
MNGEEADSHNSSDFGDLEFNSEVSYESARSSSSDTSQTHFWHQQFIKIDLKRINLTNGKQILSNVQKLSLTLRFITNELCITSNATMNEIVIPLNQLKKLKYRKKGKYLLILKRILKDFYPQGLLNYRTQLPSDPAGGELNGIESLLFVPADWVDNNTLIFFGEGVKKLWFTQVNENNLTKLDNGINNTSDNDKLQITCNFLSKKYIINVAIETKFKDILKCIHERYKVDINPSRVTYKNLSNDMITLIDDEDWNAVKWEAKISQNYNISMFFS